MFNRSIIQLQIHELGICQILPRANCHITSFKSIATQSNPHEKRLVRLCSITEFNRTQSFDKVRLPNSASGYGGNTTPPPPSGDKETRFQFTFTINFLSLRYDLNVTSIIMVFNSICQFCLPPISHRFPANLFGQLHLNPLARSAHVPLLRQGLLLHSFMSVTE